MFSLKSPVGTNYRVDPDDLMNTKRTLNQLGYYDIPPHRGIDDWTDDAIRRHQTVPEGQWPQSGWLHAPRRRDGTKHKLIINQ